MRDECVWAKTILSVYRYLERIAGAIDRLIMKRALGCCDILGENYFQNNVLTVSQRLIDLSERKVTMINLKLLTEDILNGMDEKEAQIVVEKFFDGFKTREIAERHDVSMRTIFRKIDCAVLAFSKGLVVKGYGSKNLERLLKNEQWIKNVYQRFEISDELNISFSDTYLAKAASM